jgi:hypothetical protein
MRLRYRGCDVKGDCRWDGRCERWGGGYRISFEPERATRSKAARPKQQEQQQLSLRLLQWLEKVEVNDREPEHTESSLERKSKGRWMCSWVTKLLDQHFNASPVSLVLSVSITHLGAASHNRVRLLHSG